jgi:hypothetical protein
MGWGSNPCTSNRFLYSSKPEDFLQSPIQGVSGPFFEEVKHPECKAELYLHLLLSFRI